LLQAETERATDYDVLVVGAGTAGMETALSLGDMGYKVLLVEKEPSVGGKTILLSKVFPTLDCASCISTPKMAASAHHPNVTLIVYSEVDDISRQDDGTFHVKLHRKPTYVDAATCTGCAKCEEACTVAVSDEYNYGLVARRAAHIPFPQAVPKKSVIDRIGSGPCLHTCPAGVKPSGFVSLVRAGKYEDAFRLHLDDAPLVGSLSRACYAPCEGECSRAEMEGPVHIRAIKRFMVDRYYADHPEPEYGVPETVLDTKVAVVGAGPAGLSAAFHLAKRGHQVTIFESEPEAGGMLRHGMPAYRMPNDLLDRDIKNITALGVEIKTNTPVESLQSLKDQGFGAVFVGVGGQVPRIVPVHGEDLVDVDDCMTFLKQTNVGELPELDGKHVVVIGGGNVAMDVARSAARLATKSVSIVCLEARDKMLAHEFEIEEAVEEGVNLHAGSATKRVFTDDDGQTMLEYLTVESLDFSGGKMNLTTVEGSEQQVPADVVILAVGLGASTAPFEDELELNPNKTIKVDEKTCQTSLPHVYAGGDVALGPSIIVEAMGMGRRAAAQIDRYLKGEPFGEPEFEMRLAAADKEAVLARSANASHREPSAIRKTPAHERVQSFEAYEGTFTEEEARYAANRCLDCGGCSQCHQCVSACPAGCIDFGMRTEPLELEVGSVVLSTGYSIMDPQEKPLMGFGRYPNVITAPQMDRLLAPTRPFNGVLRPSDGKEPDNIAFVLCMGSRDHTVCNPLCCRVGCMYSIKHAQLIMGALPLADVTIYYIDIRAFGKGYDEFTEQAKGMGVTFVKGKVSRIEEGENGNLILNYEEMAGRKGLQQAEHDMVVLSVGLLPNTDAQNLFKDGSLTLDDFAYVREIDEDADPARTSVDGVFAAGTVSGARDIPDTVLHSGAAATQAAAYIERLRTA
jgi:heterodisulfide reductase subunit A2